MKKFRILASITVFILASAFTMPVQTAYSNSGKYIVQSGDTLSGIASQLGTTVSALEKDNPQITNPRLLHAGDRLNIPTSSTSSGSSTGQPVSVSPQPSIPAVQSHALGSTIEQSHSDKYIVAPGDDLASIASRFGVSEAAILQANPQITNPSLLYSGDRLIIPEPVEQGTPGN